MHGGFTLAELKTLRAVERLSKAHGRTIAVFPETKHPTDFRSTGLPLEPKPAAVIRRGRLGRRECVVQSFEPTSLQRLTGLGVPLWQALGTTGGPYDLPTTTCRDMVMPTGLAGIARHADWIGPDKSSLVGTSLLADAHAAGLRVGPYTFRAENQFLPAEIPARRRKHRFRDAFAEYALYYRWGVDAVVTDFPDLAVMARRG